MFRLKVTKGENARRSEVRISINPFHAEVLLNMHSLIFAFSGGDTGGQSITNVNASKQPVSFDEMGQSKGRIMLLFLPFSLTHCELFLDHSMFYACSTFSVLLKLLYLDIANRISKCFCPFSNRKSSICTIHNIVRVSR